MSAVEFGLTSSTPFVDTLPQLDFERPVTGSHTLIARCEGLSHLSRLAASMTPEVSSRNLVALLRPLFPCDFVNILIFNEGSNDARWTSFGAEQLAPPDLPIEQTTVWSVYREQKPLWISDWQEDERSVVREEAQNASAVGYRSLCRLALCTPHGVVGVLSIASSQPYSYSEQD